MHKYTIIQNCIYMADLEKSENHGQFCREELQIEYKTFQRINNPRYADNCFHYQNVIMQKTMYIAIKYIKKHSICNLRMVIIQNMRKNGRITRIIPR